ncbi:hypothetical protein BGI40_10235 [Snodgrassella communis]|nr:hypothetical protein BGI29_09630 [Snodgrassella communis]PIT31305.1 hypothetical protein BGI40_10235 [Snodgrassella communis]
MIKKAVFLKTAFLYLIVPYYFERATMAINRGIDSLRNAYNKLKTTVENRLSMRQGNLTRRKLKGLRLRRVMIKMMTNRVCDMIETK